MIVLIGSEKGGTGKTTIATNLAQMRASRGYKVLLVDADIQVSSYLWASMRKEDNVEPAIDYTKKQVSTSDTEINKEITALAKQYDDVIIDAGGRDSQELRASLICADLLIIPTQAAQFDLWTLNTMEDLLKSASKFNPKLRAYCVINRGSTNPSVSEANEAIGLFKELEVIEFSGLILKDRISYRKAASEGKGVEEFKPLDMKARAEVEELYNFIFNSN